MNHRRRVLNLVLKNEFTGVHSLHRLNLLSRHNNLFYPTAKAADDAAADVLFAAAVDDDNHRRDFLYNDTAVRMLGDESLEKVEELRVPPPAMSFQPSPHPRYGDTLWSRMDCAVLSEARTLFVDLGSHAAFLHDAEARRVAAMPSFPERWWRDYFPVVAGAGDEGDDSVYFMAGDPEGDAGDDAANSLQFKAMVHRKPPARGSCYGRRWRLEELPRPPYADHAAGARRDAKVMVSYAMMAGGGAADASGDVICVSTEGCGTYCFDTASRTWSKAGDWALPFAGKVEHDRVLGLWLGFVRRLSYEEDGDTSLYATSDLLADVDRRSLICYAGDDNCRNLMAPWGWRKADELAEPQVVSLGSGKFCVTQFFETMRSACSECSHEDPDKGFAVLTGVEVVRRGSEEHARDGDGTGPSELRVIIHKSKRYVFTKGNTLEFVL